MDDNKPRKTKEAMILSGTWRLTEADLFDGARFVLSAEEFDDMWNYILTSAGIKPTTNRKR